MTQIRNAPRILVVDDDPAIRRSLARGLRLDGFATLVAAGGDEGLALALEHRVDVLVLDVSMPDLSGTQVCRRLRAAGHETPILMLSALDEVEDRVAGLEAGADDYLVKPFALRELVLRLRALLRRHAAAAEASAPADVMQAGAVVIDPVGRRATCGGVPLALTRREFELLLVLVRNAGIVLSREQILDRVWGYEFDVRTDVVDTFISYLRRKLEADGRPRVIHTVRGVGFMLRETAGTP